MSKNRSTNYSNYNNRAPQKQAVEQPKQDTFVGTEIVQPSTNEMKAEVKNPEALVTEVVQPNTDTLVGTEQVQPATNEPAPQVKIVEVTSHALNLRPEPKVPSRVVTVLGRGDKLTTSDSITNRWLKVKTGQGVNGYVMSEFVKEVK